MKRILAVFLILSMILPAAALAADPDPIVGCWYICFETDDKLFPDMVSQGIEYEIIILYFSEDGRILRMGTDIKATNGMSTSPEIIGTWEKNGSEYKTSIVSAGVDKAFFEDDLLYVCLNRVQYHGFRKMVPLDMYYNIYRK